MSGDSPHRLVDPAVAPVMPAASPERSPLASLEARIRAGRQQAPVVLEIGGKDGFAVRYDPNIPNAQDTYESWAERASTTRPDKTVDFDVVRFNCLVVAETATELLIDGEPYETVGEPAFRSRTVHELLNVTTAADAVREWFGGPQHDNDFEVGAHADEILRRAGLLSKAQEADPT